MLEHRSTAELAARLEQAERDGNWDRADRIEAELERRDFDASDPEFGPAYDTPSLADRGIELGSYGS